MRHMSRLAAPAAAAVLALTAGLGCSEDRDVIMTRVGDYLLEFPIDASLAGGRPAGSSVINASADGKATEITFRLSNLARLSGATYQVWLVNAETGAAFSPAGNWEAEMPNPDPDVGGTLPAGSAQGVRTFESRSNWTHTFRTSDALAGRPIGDYTHIVLSIETSEVGQDGSPSAIQPLWAQFTDMNGDPGNPANWDLIADATASFGSFNRGNSPVVFTPGGAGRGYFWGTKPDEEARVRVRDLPRPPVGYMYEGWMVPEAGRGNPFSIGPLTAPASENYASLQDADVSTDMSQFVREDRILDALNIVKNANLLNGNPWHIAEYHLKVVPKARATDELPPYTVLGGAIPESVQKREPGAQ